MSVITPFRIFAFDLRSDLSVVLDKAKVEGGVLITRRDGTMFEILPVPRKELQLDVRGVDLDLTADEIVSIIRENQER